MIRTLVRINHHHFPFARSLIFLGQGLSNSMRRIRPKRINYSAQADHPPDFGADAVILSNHGGRVMDGALAPIEVLPRIIWRPTSDELHPLLPDDGSSGRRGQEPDHVVEIKLLFHCLH